MYKIDQQRRSRRKKNIKTAKIEKMCIVLYESAYDVNAKVEIIKSMEHGTHTPNPSTTKCNKKAFLRAFSLKLNTL